jgi:hypothetical protein
LTAEPPRLPPRQSSPSSRAAERNAATYVALLAILLLGFGFLGLVALVLPQVRGILLVVFGGGAFFGMHYLLWGRWLSRLQQSATDGAVDSRPSRSNRPEDP